jgi:hypothetical protein
MLFLLAYTAFVTTYEIVFVESTAILLDLFFFVNRSADLGFVSDMIINFHLSHRDPESNLWVLDRKKIAWKYCKGWFIIDLLGTIPYSLLAPGNAVGALRFLRLIRLVKLLRILRASRIIHRLMRSLNWSMSTWAFIRTAVLLLVSIHWTSCLWYLLTVFEGSDVSWKTAIETRAEQIALENELNATDATRRFLKASGKGGGDDGEEMPTQVDSEINWYYMSTQYTLAIFGVWAFEGPKPATHVEGWFSVFMTIVAASFYAYLAGVVVELVARKGDRDRAMNGLLDGLTQYLDSIDFPRKKRKEFTGFFWRCRPYLLDMYYMELLPGLSPKLNGKLARFNFNALFDHVSFFNCKDSMESERFQTALASQLQSKMFDNDEAFVVDALHVVLEGLVSAKFGRKIFRHGGTFGKEMLLLDTPIESMEYACAITFVACSVCYPSNLNDLLETQRYPKTEKLVRRVRAKLRLFEMFRKVVAKVKVLHPNGWSRDAMEEYKARLIAFSRAETEGERSLIRHMMTQAQVAPSVSVAYHNTGASFDLLAEATEAHGAIEEMKDAKLGRVKEPTNDEIYQQVQHVTQQQERMQHGLEQLTAQVSRLTTAIGQTNITTTISGRR